MKIRYIIGAVGVTVCVLAWIALIGGLVIGVDLKARAILAVIAALSTEVLFWCMALTLGLSVFEARRKIWRWVTRAKPEESAQ